MNALPAHIPRDSSPFVWAGFNHPWVWASIAVLAINDHILKTSTIAAPWLTGKLSDVAGLFFFPLLLCALLMLGRTLYSSINSRPYQYLKHRDLIWACVATAAVFSAIQLWPAAAAAYVSGVESMARQLGGVRVTHTMDPFDLLTLPAAALSYIHGRRYAATGSSPAS